MFSSFPLLCLCRSSCLCFSLSLCHRWTDPSRWSLQTVRAGEVPFPCFFYFLPPSAPFLTFVVPAPQTCCLCTSASPLRVPFDKPCTSTRADSAAWPCPPVRTHYVKSDLPGWRGRRFRGTIICKSQSHACVYADRVCVSCCIYNKLIRLSQ